MNTRVVTIGSQGVLWDLATAPDRLFGRQEARTSMSTCALWTKAVLVEGLILAFIVLAVFLGPLLKVIAWAIGFVVLIVISAVCTAAFNLAAPYLPVAGAMWMIGLIFWAAARDAMQMMRLAKRWHVFWRRHCPLVIIQQS